MSESEPGRLAGKTILFSGGVENCTYEISLCKKQGAKTIYWGVDAARAKRRANLSLLIDPNDPDSIDEATFQIKKKLGHLHIAFNVIPDAPSIDELEASLLWLSRQILGQAYKMLETGGGTIVNLVDDTVQTTQDDAWITGLSALIGSMADTIGPNGVNLIVKPVSEIETEEEFLETLTPNWTAPHPWVPAD